MKYELTDETMRYEGRKLHRIRALRNICSPYHSTICEGDLGGWVESENNLSHDGGCWVGGDAKVYGNARISGDANINAYANVFDDAVVTGTVDIRTCAQVYGNAEIRGTATDPDGDTSMIIVGGRVCVCDNARIYGKNIHISNDCTINKNMVIRDCGLVTSNDQIYHEGKVTAVKVGRTITYDGVERGDSRIILIAMALL